MAVVVLMALVMAGVDVFRWLFAMGSAHVAVREGVRQAAVCDPGSAGVAARMAPWLATAVPGRIEVQASPSGCTPDAGRGQACQSVQVSVSGYAVPPLSWMLPSLPLPTLSSSLPRESLDSRFNPSCL